MRGHNNDRLPTFSWICSGPQLPSFVVKLLETFLICLQDSNTAEMETEKVVSATWEHANLDMTQAETLDLIRHAQESDAADKLLTIRQALSKYKKAVFWAMFLSTSLVMEGYDLVIVSHLYSVDESCNNPSRSTLSMAKHSSKTDLASKIQRQGKRLFPQAGSQGCPTRHLLDS